MVAHRLVAWCHHPQSLLCRQRGSPVTSVPLSSPVSTHWERRWERKPKKQWVRRLAVRKVGKGDRVQFWDDVWCGEVPLSVIFPKLHNISRNQGVSVVYRTISLMQRWRIMLKGDMLVMANKWMEEVMIKLLQLKLINLPEAF
uniref:Reverse transcriptase zinc-binding domain-containing protein n=1 Tax=Oryza glaberrima TaxID=4538 RepID=I1Q9W3_ORYGL